MPTTPEQIDLWRSEPKERQQLEFKEAKNQLGTDVVCEYCVAIANEGRGHLLLGIADRPPRPVVGSNAFADTNAIAKSCLSTSAFELTWRLSRTK